MFAYLLILTGLVLWAVIPALSSQLATNYLLHFKPRFQYFLLLTLCTFFAVFAALLFADFIFSSDNPIKHEDKFIPLASYFVIKVLMFSKYIRHPETGAIGAKNALKVILLTLVPELVIWFVLAMILMVLFNSHIF